MNAQHLPGRRLCGGGRVTLAAQWTSRADRPQPLSCPSPGNSSRPRSSSRSSP